MGNISLRFSPEMGRFFDQCLQEAIRHNSRVIGPEHIMYALLKGDDSQVRGAIEGLTTPEWVADLEKELDARLHQMAEGQDDSRQPEVTPLGSRILRLSALEARVNGDESIGPMHLLLAMAHNNEVCDMPFMRSLIERGVDYAALRRAMAAAMPKAGPEFAEDDSSDGDEGDSGRRRRPSRPGREEGAEGSGRKAKSDTPMLDKYGHDMTRAAEEDRLDPVVGRETEIERLAQILSRRKKNNPVLIGEPGVGKSAIVEGLALRIVHRQVSRVLFGKRVVALDMASLVAGTKYRGEFEERVKGLLNELSRRRDIILFIDEVHTLVGAGNSAGQMDAANLLKPALARGELQCVGATTLDEYRKNIEKDAALERRFQKVMVEPTSAEETLAILNNIRDKYEKHHNVVYSPEAVRACVSLTQRYISDRNFPDKAIDAMDEAGARAHITNIVVPKEIEALEQQVEDATRHKLEAAKAQDFESAASYRDQAQQLSQQLDEARRAWEQQTTEHPEVVDEDRVAEVVAMMTGVPVQRIAQAEGRRLRSMAPTLRQQIIGQDEAIEKIVKAIQRNRLGLKDPNKPIGTFMFLGPTGVGKTHLAKRLAEYLFDSADSLIRIDMSEYMEKFNVTRLVGAPPGYVGYEEGGQLTEKVRRHPYSVVLLDEIEKAHPDVFNLLLQVMDEGRLTDSLGRRVDFKNTIIIMTSNIGTRQLKDFGAGVGFNTAELNKDYAESVLKKALNKTFSPEFLNRVDDIVMFGSLDRAAISRIIDIELRGLYRRIEDMGYHLDLSPEAKAFIADKGCDSQYGARPLKRALQRYLEDTVAALIIDSEPLPGSTIRVGVNADATDVVLTAAPATPAAD